MSHEYEATVLWRRGDAKFTDNRYSRGHVWKFDGIEIPGSSAPSSVRLPYSVAEAVDPEEALVAAVSSCHMLFFLAFAAQGGFTVDRYEDAAVGVMTENERGKLFVSRARLRPAGTFTGDKRRGEDDVAALLHRSHEECFIANSVKSEVVVEPTFSFA